METRRARATVALPRSWRAGDRLGPQEAFLQRCGKGVELSKEDDMSQATCRHCGGSVASSAPLCPHCGGTYPAGYGSQMKWPLLLIVLVIVVIVIATNQ